MTRKEALKKQKEEKRVLRDLDKFDSHKEAKKTIFILIGVILFIGLAYVVGLFFTGELSFKKKDYSAPEATIQYEEILIGQVLNRESKEYYVLFYDEETSPSLTGLSSLPDKRIYKVNMDNVLNRDYKVGEGEKANNNVKNIKSVTDLKVKTPTAIKVKDGKVTEYKEGEDTVYTYLSDL